MIEIHLFFQHIEGRSVVEENLHLSNKTSITIFGLFFADGAENGLVQPS